jgi:hypothetical protein
MYKQQKVGSRNIKAGTIQAEGTEEDLDRSFFVDRR